MRSRSGIESAFISRSWRSLVQPRMGRQFIAWRRQPQGIPNEPTIILSPRGGGRGNSRQGRRWCRVARADRDSQVSALGVGLPSGAPFRCKHRIMHRKRGPGQRGPRFPGFGVGRGFAIWGPFPVRAPDSAPETWTWSTRSEGGRQLAGPQPRRKPDRVQVPNMPWTCCRRCRVARADRDSQVSALGVGLRSGAPFRCTHRIAHRKRGPLSTRTLRCTLPFQLSMALVALLALFLPTATLASRNNARRRVHDIDDFLGSSPASRSNQSHPSH